VTTNRMQKLSLAKQKQVKEDKLGNTQICLQT